MEVLWKPTTSIINRRLNAAIQYHSSLHGLQTGRGTGTATLKAKLIHQMTAMMEAVLHTILLDPHKAYDALERYWRLDILAVYGVGPQKPCMITRDRKSVV